MIKRAGHLAFRLSAFVSMVFAPLAAQAQAQTQGTVEVQPEMALMIGVAVNVVFLVICGVILLIAKRDMKGWDQPLKFVWFSFQGRLNRKAYWLKGAVVLSMIMLIVQTFALVLQPVAGGVAMVLILPALLFQFWASIAMLVKRAHDLGHSGWWVLGVLVPVWNIWVSIKAMFFRGQVGPNVYGPDPIDIYGDYIAELTGGGGQDPAEAAQDASAASRPTTNAAPDNAPGGAPKGFGSRTFAPPAAKGQAPEQAPGSNSDSGPARPLQDTPDMDLIKRRLGGAITAREDD